MSTLKSLNMSLAFMSLTLIVTASSCSKAPGAVIESSGLDNPHVLGGELVTSDDPVSKSTVALVIDGGSADKQILCTATLITPNVLITAAHCLDDKPKFAKAVFSLSVGIPTPEIVRNISRVSIHPQWTKEKAYQRFDMALVKFEGEIPTGYVPAKIFRGELVVGDQITYAGYGVTDLATSANGILHKAIGKVSEISTDTELAIVGKDSGACFGDSGGPAFVTRNKQLQFWGVASAVNSEKCDKHAIYTSVDAFKVWISKTLERFSKPLPPAPQGAEAPAPVPQTPAATP